LAGGGEADCQEWSCLSGTNDNRVEFGRHDSPELRLMRSRCEGSQSVFVSLG
jgi:hypothetical protein